MISTPCGEASWRLLPGAGLLDFSKLIDDELLSPDGKHQRHLSFRAAKPPSLESQQDLGVGVDLLLEAISIELREAGNRSLALVEHHLPDQVVDVGIARLEQVSGDVPGLENAPPNH